MIIVENAKVILDLANWQGFVLIVVAILGLFILIGNTVKTWREIRGPEKTVKDSVAEIQTRISEHDAEIKEMHEGLRYMCEASRALLNHAIHNGNTSEMENASKDLDKYLTKRI